MLAFIIYSLLALCAVYIYSIYSTADMLQTIEPGMEMSAFTTFVYQTGQRFTK